MNALVESPPQKIELNDENFSSIFHDVRKKHKPQKGEVLVCWRSSADFVDGWVKQQVLRLLATNKTGASTARTIMKNVVGAIERDSIKICLDMTEDLLANMTPKQILDKSYPFVVEMFYWVKPEYIPNDVHWSIIKTLDLRDVAKTLDIAVEDLLTKPEEDNSD